MLVLTRKVNEIIVIADAKTGAYYEIVVTEIRGDSVRLGVRAPRDVSVDRKEVALSKSAHPDKLTV